ncbi:unnamed protein product [Dicrocoelium dendriticum]|nr:unnamed protein product [Dicrocoelium dendriticum]
MCGRTACALDPDTLPKKCTLNIRYQSSSKGKTTTVVPRWNTTKGSSAYVPSYNIAPGSYSPVLCVGKLVDSSSCVVIQPMRWGLVPSFARDDSYSGYTTTNARIESLLEKPTYGSSLREGKRCVIVVQGFYEWKAEKGRKQPYFIYPSDPEKLLMMAGVFAYNKSKDLYSYSVITADSAGVVATIHHRMPVILSTDEEVFTWLDSSSMGVTESYKFLLHLANTLRYAPICMHPVTVRMNSTKFDGPACIAPLDDVDEVKKSAGPLGSQNIMTAFFKRKAKSERRRRRRGSIGSEAIGLGIYLFGRGTTLLN